MVRSVQYLWQHTDLSVGGWLALAIKNCSSCCATVVNHRLVCAAAQSRSTQSVVQVPTSAWTGLHMWHVMEQGLNPQMPHGGQQITASHSTDVGAESAEFKTCDLHGFTALHKAQVQTTLLHLQLPTSCTALNEQAQAAKICVMLNYLKG